MSGPDLSKLLKAMWVEASKPTTCASCGADKPKGEWAICVSVFGFLGEVCSNECTQALNEKAHEEFAAGTRLAPSDIYLETLERWSRDEVTP